MCAETVKSSATAWHGEKALSYSAWETGRMTWLNLAAWIFLCLGAGAIGARWTAPEIHTWYRGLRKPIFNPPDRIFGPVWTFLYILMAIAMWRIDAAPASELHAVCHALFVVQLALNLAWSWIFFRHHALGVAAIELFFLWLAIAATMGVFALVDPLAAGAGLAWPVV